MFSALPLLAAAWLGVADLPPITVKGHAPNTRSSTALKTDTPLRDTPQSISVVTEDQLRDRGVQGIAEAARYVPGVGFAQGEGNRETPIFRGIASTGDFFVDGIRDDVQYYRDLYNIERVEVFKGPNAMIFGRGATGGLINRVTKVPSTESSRSGTVTFGAWRNRRATIDLNQPFTETWSGRLAGLVEDSRSYRQGVVLRRQGVNPTIAWQAGPTRVDASLEHFADHRTADRGFGAWQGRPLPLPPGTFVGDPDHSPTGTTLDAAAVVVRHRFGNGVALVNRVRLADQAKDYQNVYGGPVSGDGTSVTLAAYANRMHRRSVFNQTDLTFGATIGATRHHALIGVELGQERSTHVRTTGYFADGTTSLRIPLAAPTVHPAVTFRQSATDTDADGVARVAALYVQDQADLTRHVQLVAGLRYDRFRVRWSNHRTGAVLSTDDGLVSPRLGVVVKPVPAMSLYANLSVAHQPRAGDQLTSLTVTNAALAPERFRSLEAGVKWEVRPDLAATVAAFRLDRRNAIVLDPTDPTGTRTTLSDGQRSQGLELGLDGNVTPAWRVSGGYAYTRARFLSATSATLRAGARVAQVPRHALALWNRYDVSPAWGAGLGVIHRGAVLAANELVATSANAMPNVTLPGYTRLDAALYWRLAPAWRLQLNVENLLDRRYAVFANSNNNITPGSPRAWRLTLDATY